MRHIVAMVAAILPLAACAPTPVRISIPFDEAKARAMLAPGTNQVSGRVRVEQENGTLVSCTGSVVNLIPATAYAREWVRQFYELDSGKYGTENAAYRLDAEERPIEFAGAGAFYAATLSTRCDDDGDFSFANVGNGQYFVVARVRWLGKDHQYYDFLYGVDDAQEEDGSVMEKVTLDGNEVIDLQWKPRGPGILGGEGLAPGR